MLKQRLLGAVFALAASATAASAADLAVPPAPVPPVLLPMYTWTGGFVGVQAGYMFNNDDNNGFGGGSDDGWLAGIHAGFNWQYSNLVVGIDGSWSWTDLGNNGNNDCRINNFRRGDREDINDRRLRRLVRGGFNCDHEMNWIADIRGRLGFAWDRFHFYGAAGLAVADIDRDFGFRRARFTDNNNNENSDSVTGWTAGLGAEWAITPNWTIGIEWKYYDLDDDNFDLRLNRRAFRNLDDRRLRFFENNFDRNMDNTFNVIQVKTAFKF